MIKRITINKLKQNIFLNKPAYKGVERREVSRFISAPFDNKYSTRSLFPREAAIKRGHFFQEKVAKHFIQIKEFTNI